MRGRAQQKVVIVSFENMIPFSPTQDDPDYNPRNDRSRRPARPNRNRRREPSLSEDPVTSGEESQGTCSASVSGSDQQSGDEDDQDEATVPKTLVPPRERRPTVNPDVSSDSEEERPSTSHAADVPRPRRHRRRPSYLEDFALDSDSDYIDLT
uniref:Uncharacterized protein n=1 Tax=Branchiostoma floridae TaxID=7739 RepID=C3YV75_BRAFL|eukprot:XP_002599779.1 hypothetical protein BRAFLDRAFT_119324 [Branchiostoma floridae]